MTDKMTLSELRKKRELVIHGIRYLDMGACKKDGFRSCALYPYECNVADGEIFTAHDQSSSTMSRCNPNDYKIGRCLKENTCALRSSDCAEDVTASNFRDKDDFCTHQRDHSVPWDISAPAFTQFGSCKNTATNEYFCIYNPEDCNLSGTEVYATPAETKEAGIDCDCSQVHVTACKTESDRVMCAVNKAACNQSYMYKLSPLEQREQRNSWVDKLDCRLCKKSNTVKPTPSPTNIGNKNNDNILAVTTDSPNTAPTPAPSKETLVSDAPSNEKSNTPVIIGVSVSGVALLGVLIFVFIKLGISKRKLAKDFNSTSTDPSNLEIAF